jgi:hypothetical protein
MAPGCTPVATTSVLSAVYGAVRGRDGVGLHAGGHIVVVLNAVKHVTVVFDTGSRMAIVLGSIVVEMEREHQAARRQPCRHSW